MILAESDDWTGGQQAHDTANGTWSNEGHKKDTGFSVLESALDEALNAACITKAGVVLEYGPELKY
jgi:hypothetical protein